jgi:site-specific recombinase XerD
MPSTDKKGQVEPMKGILAKLERDMELRGFSDNTKDQYRRIIDLYLRRMSKPLEETGEGDIRGYLEYLKHTKKLANTSVNAYLAAIWFLYEVVCDRQLNRKQVPFMKRPRKLPEVLSRDEVAAIIDATENTKHKAMFMLAYSAGLRVSEIARLTAGDIDSTSMRIFVRAGKGDKDRYTLLSKTCLDMLRRYWAGCRPAHPQGYLFLGVRSLDHITSAAIENAFNNALAASGVRKNVSIHSLRHSFATHLLENGAGLADIKELLGHASLSSTTVYLHLASITDRVVSPLDLPYVGKGA